MLADITEFPSFEESQLLSQHGTDTSFLYSISCKMSNSLLTTVRLPFHIGTRDACAEVAMKIDSINTVST